MGNTNDGARYDLRDGLHSAEIRLLQRALREHLQTANGHKAALINARHDRTSGDTLVSDSEIQNAQDSIDALIRVSNRLRKELVTHNDVITSVTALRDELSTTVIRGADVPVKEMVLKLNSCLKGDYPVFAIPHGAGAGAHSFSGGPNARPAKKGGSNDNY